VPHERRHADRVGARPAAGLLRPPSRRAAEPEWEEWLAEATERLDPFMAWLGVLFGLLVGFELAVSLQPPAATAVAYAGWVIWAIFLFEFLAKLVLAPDRRRFLRRHWLQALALAVPTLRLLRFLRLLRLGRALPAARVLSTSYRTAGTAGRLLRSRLSYVGALTAIATIAIAQLAFVLERGNRTFSSFGDASLWALAVVIGMQGDPTPQTTAGRLVMIVGFGVGLVLVASLAGTLGAFFVEPSRADADARDGGTADR
jgi:voltage-gated potassium channel